jgi:hypothetical protein
MKVEEPVKAGPDQPDLPLVVNAEILEDVLGVIFFLQNLKIFIVVKCAFNDKWLHFICKCSPFSQTIKVPKIMVGLLIILKF